jgi:hypothetical protein
MVFSQIKLQLILNMPCLRSYNFAITWAYFIKIIAIYLLKPEGKEILNINILYMPKTGIEPISKSYKEFILPIKLFRPLPWERIELTYLYLQNSALTTKQPRLYLNHK